MFYILQIRTMSSNPPTKVVEVPGISCFFSSILKVINLNLQSRKLTGVIIMHFFSPVIVSAPTPQSKPKKVVLGKSVETLELLKKISFKKSIVTS